MMMKEPDEFLDSVSYFDVRQQAGTGRRTSNNPQQLRNASTAHGAWNNPQHGGAHKPLEMYDRKLETARWAARTVGSFYGLSKFLAVCSLTWATVVLLGAFVGDLRFVDYAMVTSLILLEAIRLASAAFFTILLTHDLARLSQDPINIIHGRDDHYRRALTARIFSSILQGFLIAPSIACPIIRFHILNYNQNRNLHISILIFYILIFCNAFVSLICSSAAFFYLRDRYDQSLLRYYDEVVQNAISTGVIQADNLAFFQFAYEMLGKEYARIVQPEAVVKNHKNLVAYLYNHRLGQDFLLIFLDADDAFVQQAAVNMVGFWGDPTIKVGLKEVKLSKTVLSKMADKVGAGQVGWAAANSFGGLARRNPRILTTIRTGSGTPLLDRLAELVEESSSSLVFVRTLVLFYHHSLLAQEELEKKVRELEEKLAEEQDQDRKKNYEKELEEKLKEKVKAEQPLPLLRHQKEKAQGADKVG